MSDFDGPSPVGESRDSFREARGGFAESGGIPREGGELSRKNITEVPSE